MPKPWELKTVGGAAAEPVEPVTAKPWEFKQSDETLIEPILQAPTDEEEAGFGENFGKGFISGIYNIGTFMYGAGEAYHRPIAGGVSLSDLTPLQMGLKLFAPETAKSMRDGTADILAELADQSAKMSQKVLETGEIAADLTEAKFDRGADPESWGVAFGSGAASLLPIIASGGVSAGLVIPTVGLQSFGTTYQRARTAYTEQGLSVEDAAQSAMIPALGQASVDMLMTKAGGALANKFGATNIEALNKAVRSPGFRDGVKGLSSKLGLKLKAATKGALIEGTIEEAPANFIGEYFIARHTFDPTVTLAQAGQEAWKSWVVGAGLGGGMGMVQKVETHDDVTAAARDAARRETIRSVAPTTASRLDERDAASLVLPDEEGVLEPMVIPLPEEGDAKPVFPETARDKIVNEARKKGTLPLWWNRYEGDVGPEGTTVPSGLRYADQETVNRFIEDQEAHNELSQMSVEEDENGDWEVKRKGKAVDVFETEQEARQAAREAALAAAPVKVQNRIKRYKELTQKLVELDALDQSYQQQLERSQAQATEEEAAAVTPDISQEDQAFVAEKLGISIEDLKYSGLNITQEMVDQLRFAPEGSGIREFLNAAEKARQESPETPVTPLGDVRRIQDEAAKRAAEIKAERDQKELEAELISAKLQADAIAADTEMRTEREEEEGVPPALRRPTRPTEPKNSQQLGQLAERAVEDSAREGVTETDRTILNRLLERKATAVADSYGVKDEQQINSFVDLINQIDSQIAAVLGTPAPAPATQADLASMQESYADIEVEAPPVVPTAPEPEPVMTMKVGDTEVRVVNRTSGIDGVAHAARPSVTGAQMQPTLLKNINAALERISKRFGSILNLSEIQLTRIGGGAGVGSIARVGVTDSLLVDVDRLASSMSNKKFSLEKALEEELLHNLDGQALRAEYARLVRSGELSPTVDVRSFIESRYREIHNNMTADERAAARALYGNDFIDGVHMAQEFVRQLIQKRHTKSITEESYRGRPIKRLLKILGRMFNRMNLSSPLRAHVANVESFLERSYKTEIREATRAENKQRIKDERVARKQLLADEKKAKKERAVQEVRDQEDAYAATVEAVSYVANNRNFSWLNPQQGQSYGARIVDEVYDSWLKQYKAGKLTQPVPPKEWFKKAAMRRAGNLAQAEFGTEKRGSEIEFSSFEAAKEDYGLDPADNRPATESGERFISVVKEFNHLVNLNPTQLTAFEARLRNYSNPETATMLGIAGASASTSFTQAIDKIAEASRNNANLRNVFIDAAQDPNFFIDASAVAYAADPIIRQDRVAGLVEAQKKYQEGGKTRAEWDELNNAVEKFKAIARDYPQPTKESLLSRETIISSLAEDKAKKAKKFFADKDKGQSVDGEVIDVRIDIPAYKATGNYVVTFHPKGKGGVIGYDSFVHLTGFGDTGRVEFVEGKDKKKIDIATGVEGRRGDKSSFARARGAVASTTVIPDVTGPEWTQVGFDPERHSYFYNRANPTMRVTSGTEAVSIGNTVFVRNAEMEDAFDSGVAYAAAPSEKKGAIINLYNKLVKGGETRNLELLVERYAKESGYTIRASHGLRGEGLEGGAFDPERLGSNTGAPSASMGFFFSKGQTSQAYADVTLKKDEADEINHRAYQDVLELAEKVDSITGIDDTLKDKLASWPFFTDDHAWEIVGRLGAVERAAELKKGLIDSTAYESKAVSGVGPKEFIADLQTSIVAVHNAIDDIAKQFHPYYTPEILTGTPAQQKANDAIFSQLDELSRSFGKKVKALEELDDNYAARFSILDTFLKIENPLVSDQKGKSYREESYFDLLARARREGHDGAIIQNTYDGGPMDDIYVIFDPNQAKSAKAIERDSSGEIIPLEKRFDPTTDLIAYAADPHMASNPDKTLASRILNGLGNVKKQLFRAFSSDGGLIMPSATNADKQLNFCQPKINKDAYINSVLGEVRGENRRLKKAVEKEFGKPTEQDVATMNNALNGNPDALEQLTPEIRDIILTMRTQIDALSGYIVKKGWVTGSLKATIDENIGTYLARSYRIFDEKGYVDNIDPEIQNQAITFVEQQLIKQGRSPIEAQQEAQARVAEMLQEYSKNDARDMFDRGKLGEKDLSLFMKRKDIAPEIRALLGEYTDPAVNYARSISRLAHFVGNHQFLTELKKAGMNEVFFDAKDFEGRNAAGADTAITGKVAGVKIKEGEEDVSRGSYSPLAGLYTTKEVADLLNQYDRMSGLTEVMGVGHLIKLNVFTKSMKTVASVMTHVRNLLGQPYFLLMNGHNPLAYRKARKAIAAIWADAAGSDKAAQAYFNKMTRLGLVGEEMTTAELRRVMGNFQNEFDNSDSAQELLDRGTGKLIKATKQVWSAMVRTYRASDEIGKIMNFEMEKEALRPIRPDSTEAELEAEAAQRTRGGIPTYSMLPPTVQMLRMQPFVGPFMSFFYEAGRTQVMNIKYAMQEMGGGTTAHRAYAAKRIVGHFAATVGMGYLLQMAAKAWFGISDEEEENFREFLPEWEKDAQFIMWRDKEGQLQYVNISYNNPYSTTTDKLLAMAFISGKPEETVGKNIASKTREMLDPFTSETIAAQAVLNLARNKDQYGNKIWNEQADFGDQFADAFEHGAKALTPATIERGWSKWRPAYLGKHLPKSARVPVLGDELLAEVTGFRIRTMDYEDAMLQGSFGAAADISEANYIFNQAAGRGGIVTDEEMLDAYEKANEARFRNFQQMAKKVRAAQLGGLKRHQIMSSMKIGKMSSADSASIINERFRPMFPSPQIIKKARDKGHAIPLQEINELRRKWMRKPLFENGE